MSLELGHVARQIDQVATTLSAGQQEWRDRLKLALEALSRAGQSLDDLKLKIVRSQGKSTWLVALPSEGLDLHHDPPAVSADFSVIGVDGSHIDVDRHRPVRCYLINTGWAALRYGGQPVADLGSRASLYAEERDLVLADPQGNRDQPIEGALLGMKRSVEECRRLAEMAQACPGTEPLLALVDGSLIMWGLTGQTYPDFVRQELLDRGLLRCLDDIRQACARRPVAVASYISLPRSADVVNTIRLALCPQEVADCDQNCPRQSGSARVCDAVAGLLDRDIFERALEPGQRSGLFATGSKIVADHYGENAVSFFYLRLEDEVTRVEVPRWVAQDAGLVGLVHSLVLDQCHRGNGYPVALAEAHEQAVVTGADRDWFWQTVDESLAGQHMSTYRSAKSRSKSTRWV